MGEVYSLYLYTRYNYTSFVDAVTDYQKPILVKTEHYTDSRVMPWDTRCV